MKKASIIFWVMLFCILSGCSRSGRRALLLDGTIVFINGNITVDGKPGREGDRVSPGMTVSTDRTSWCEIVFNEKNVFRIGEDTIIKIAPDSGADIDIRAGYLAAVFGKLNGGRGDRFRVRTPGSVLGVRGTEFFVKVLSTDVSYICICNGRLSVRQGKLVSDMASRHHKARYFRREGGKSAVEDAPLLYHDDVLMEAVASRVGINLYWY